ncbi:hypothetical protein N7G274_006130 [Stereocaulon virgatum]|uniref:Holocytochrome c-type synthase n=1 Tax=Stereocaulon virgatum TaxID=373712 RepID=A0ABR4A728_9LECA
MGNATSSQLQQPPNSPPPSACPVDPSARAAWLEAAKDTRNNNNNAPLPPSAPPTPSSKHTSPPPHPTKNRPLASDRVTSSIPRSELSPATSTPSPYSPPSSTATTPPSSHWIYPSEKMFFEAMKRKNHSPEAADMATVVPIHNAVNERAWSEIKSWEHRFAAAQNKQCNGPMLRSFSGDSKKLSPRARWLGLWGYESPFDRHDWVVERCEGESVEYLIDFYKGKGGGLSFYLDVRPKLNSWEGWRMRLGRLVGL